MSSGSSSDSLGELLSVPFKKGSKLELESPLLAYVKKVYPDADESSVSSDIAQMQRMRDRLIESNGLVSDALVEAHQTYLLALARLEPRFAIGTSHSSHARVNFTWYDAFKTGKKVSIPNIHVERAAVLFNLGALYCGLATSCDRQLNDGLKNAIHNLQRAAGCFGLLRSSESLKASINSSQIVDVSSSCVSMLEELMLAQAQECIFNTAARSRKSPSLLSRISEQVAVYYESAESFAKNAPLHGYIDAKWVEHMTIKKLYFRSLAFYHCALHLQAARPAPGKEDGHKIGMGEEISRLQATVAHIDRALSFKSAESKYSSDLRKFRAIVNEALGKAINENNHIYNERVVPNENLPKIQPQAVAKSHPVENKAEDDETVCNLFKSIVPESATREFSKFTNKVDEFISFRNQVSRLKESTEDIEKRQSALEITELLKALSGNAPLPEALGQEIEGIQSNGGVTALDRLQDQLQHLHQICKDMLKAVETELHAEGKSDLEMREQYGSQWTRPPSMELTEDILKNIEHHYSNLKTAAENDKKLGKMLSSRRKELTKLLSPPPHKVTPVLQAQMVQVDEPEKLVDEINAALGELSSLKEAQSEITNMLNQLKNSDDALERVMSDESHEKIYREHMKERFIPMQNQVTSNIAEQKNQVTRLESAVKKFKTAYAVDQWKIECSQAHAQAGELVRVYTTIQNGMQGGITFYSETQEVISTLQKQTDEFLAKRERDKNDLAEQLARLSFQQSQSASALPSPPVGLRPINTMNAAMGQPVSQGSPYHQHAQFNTNTSPHAHQGSSPYAQPPQNGQMPHYNPGHSQYLGHGGNWQDQGHYSAQHPELYQQPQQQYPQGQYPSTYDGSQAYQQYPQGQFYGQDQQPGYHQGYRR